MLNKTSTVCFGLIRCYRTHRRASPPFTTIHSGRARSRTRFSLASQINTMSHALRLRYRCPPPPPNRNETLRLRFACVHVHDFSKRVARVCVLYPQLWCAMGKCAPCGKLADDSVSLCARRRRRRPLRVFVSCVCVCCWSLRLALEARLCPFVSHRQAALACEFQERVDMMGVSLFPDTRRSTHVRCATRLPASTTRCNCVSGGRVCGGVLVCSSRVCHVCVCGPFR